MRFEYKTLHYPPNDSPDVAVGEKDKEDWQLLMADPSDDGLMTMWRRERRPMGGAIREAREDA